MIGSLYMCAGHWHEAMRELTEGATRARAYSDHLWQAKALENIMVCLLLFAWSGMDFQVSLFCIHLVTKLIRADTSNMLPHIRQIIFVEITRSYAIKQCI